MVNDPELATKSPALDGILQYSVVPLAIPVVVTLNVRDEPSLIEVTPPAAEIKYVGDCNVCVPAPKLTPAPNVIGIRYIQSNTPCRLNIIPSPATTKLPQNKGILTARILADSNTIAN